MELNDTPSISKVRLEKDGTEIIYNLKDAALRSLILNGELVINCGTSTTVVE